jgi:hypothetical protein
VTPDTRKRYFTALRLLVQWMEGTYPPGQWPPLTEGMFLAMLVEMRAGGYAMESGRQVQKGLAKLAASLSVDPPYNLKHITPFFKGWSNLSTKAARGPIGGEKVARVLAAIFASPNPSHLAHLMAAYALLGYFALLRISEVLLLEPTDLCRVSAGLLIRATCPKTYSHPVVVVYNIGGGVTQVPDESVTAILSAFSISPPQKLRQQARAALASLFLSIFPATPQQFFSFHSLRHGRVSDLYASFPTLSHKARLLLIQPLGRWKSTASVSFYLHTNAKKKARNQEEVDLEGLRCLAGILAV